MSIAPIIPMTDWKRQRSQVRKSHSEKVCLRLKKRKRRKFFSQEKLKSIPSRKERKGELLCIEGDDKDGGDDLPAHGKPEHKDGVVNVAQLSVK